MRYIGVIHNIEVAHRLFETQGKCEAIHGHSMKVELQIYGQVDSHGLLGGIEFGALKKEFRAHLDEEYDHRLLLNTSDPFAQPVQINIEGPHKGLHEGLPGLNVMPGDPTTEHIAKWIMEWAETLDMIRNNPKVEAVNVNVDETAVNFAGAARGINF